MSAGRRRKDGPGETAMSLRREPEWTWCPELAHGWYDAVYTWGTGCPHPVDPPSKAKKPEVKGDETLIWQWCPDKGHGLYEGVNKNGFFRDCEKCVAEGKATGLYS